MELGDPDIQAAASLCYQRGRPGRRHRLKGRAPARAGSAGPALVTQARDPLVRHCHLRTLLRLHTLAREAPPLRFPGGLQSGLNGG